MSPVKQAEQTDVGRVAIAADLAVIRRPAGRPDDGALGERALASRTRGGEPTL